MVNLSPDFSNSKLGISSIPPTELVEHALSLQRNPSDFAQEATDAAHQQPNCFPVDAFPAPYRDIILDTHSALSFPIDFIGAAMLYAPSVAIGNTYALQMKDKWTESASVFVALVGSPGTNKSHPVSWALDPIMQRDRSSFRKFMEEMAEYEQTASALAGRGSKQQEVTAPNKPALQKHLTQDATPEAFKEVLKQNSRGVGVYYDELAAFLQNFNRYNKGSEQEDWLTIWSGKQLISDRLARGPRLIPRPFASVIGTIQNRILKEFGKNNRNQNGFIDRFLFAIPDQLKRPYFDDSDIDPSVSQRWQTFILNLLDLKQDMDEDGTPKPRLLKLNAEAMEVYKGWSRYNTDLINATSNEDLKGLYAKLDTYVLRFALILQLMHWATGVGEKQSVEVDAMQGAIKLVEYFRITGKKARALASDSNPKDDLTRQKTDIYESLPSDFATAAALQVGEEFGLSRRTMFSFLEDDILYEKIKHGYYRKRI